MVLDGHIHIIGDSKGEGFAEKLKAGAFDGGIVISQPPPSMNIFKSGSLTQRMEQVLKFKLNDNIFPFFWIDPIADDSVQQVSDAVKHGAMGFKVICDTYFPSDERALRTFNAIAKAGKPLMFHSGILWNGRNSSRYNRPAEFEAMLDVPGIRFSLAHISWPWCDECLAVFGKIQYANMDNKPEMFIDMTPGTPVSYRKEVLTKLFTIGYRVENNIWYGSDSLADDYGWKWAREWVERDTAIMTELNISKEVMEKVFSGNLKRFVGVNE